MVAEPEEQISVLESQTTDDVSDKACSICHASAT